MEITKDPIVKVLRKNRIQNTHSQIKHKKNLSTGTTLNSLLLKREFKQFETGSESVVKSRKHYQLTHLR